MKHSNKAVIGDVIRAYDFKPMAGRGDSYVEGVVENDRCTDLGYLAYKITVTADKFSGDVETEANHNNRIGQIIYVPHEVSLFEFDFRVVNLGKV